MAGRNNDTEEAFLKNYDPSVFARPSTAVDAVIFTVFDSVLHVLTVKRANHPYQGRWSLVGGYVDIQCDNDLEATARRKLAGKTGVNSPYLEQFRTIGNKDRDPRGWSITTVYFALMPSHDIVLKAGKGASNIKWSKVDGGKVKDKLAFDHDEILRDCFERLRSKVLYTSLPIHLMPGDFTLGELQKVYEVILNDDIDHKSFRRRILGADILEETGEMRADGNRPAKLYRLRNKCETHYFVRNIEGSS
ncbi:MAG: NUDIX hydrolase [Alphaproteobacteria bacterium]|nr:NUDIX hydrolase [Alphaproteobacteria bacterium]